MTFFNDMVDKLFPRKDSSNQVVHNEVINRTESYQQQYANWLKQDAERVYGEVLKGYEEKRNDQENSKVRVHLLQSKYSNGIAISYDELHFSKQEFSFLFDSLGHKAESLPDYRKVNADYLIREKNNQMETREKYYLKPQVSADDEIADQQFGNILIDHILINDKPSYIKLVANIYSDSKYSKAKDFEELIQNIIK